MLPSINIIPGNHHLCFDDKGNPILSPPLKKLLQTLREIMADTEHEMTMTGYAEMFESILYLMKNELILKPRSHPATTMPD